MLDFGEGCSTRLQQLGMTICDVDAVYISHLHPDHYMGLFDAAVTALEHGYRRKVKLLAATEVFESIETVINILPQSFKPYTQVEEIPLKGKNIGTMKLIPIKSRHSIPTYGVLVKTGDSANILYTSDTAPNPDIYQSLEKAELDILIHEVTLPSKMKQQAYELGHTSVSHIIEMYTDLRISATIVATHLTKASEQELIECLSNFKNDSPLIIACDRLIIKI